MKQIVKQILYNELLEKELISFIRKGGKAIITNDFFWKNSDNVFRTKLPEFYTEVLGVEDNNFIHVDEKSPVILLEKKFGKGDVIMLNKNATEKDWKLIHKFIN